MGIFKILKTINEEDRTKELDRYNLNKEEKEAVRKGNYEPDEFDRDDDEDSDEDE